jgi:uncharacterized protein (TIGR01777 family)
VRILIAGGSGLLGRALASRLATDDHDVVVLTRRPSRAADVRWAGDERDTEWHRLLHGAGAVINLAGESIAAGRWSPRRKAAIRDSRLGATRALAAGINAAGAPVVFLSGSAVGYYGRRGDEELTEQAAGGDDFLARVCRDWEEEAQTATAASRTVLLRTGLVLAGEGGALPQMALPFRLGLGGRVGSGRQYMPWIHIDDWVGLVRAALGSAVAGPLNLTAPNPVTNAELSKELGRALHRPALLPVPAFALRLALGEMADALLLGGQRVIPERAMTMGYQFRYPTIGEAFAEIYGR